MSEHIPEPSPSPSVPLSKRHSKRSKYDKAKLPTPPPDPTGNKDHKDVLEYLESLVPNYSRSTSTFSPVIATDDAFDHLEKLYKLMEQMLELREQNAKLHRRIRDLEHLNNLEKMHKEVEMLGVEKECPELDRDTAFAETILESILADSARKDKQKTMTPTRLRPSILRRQRNRSNSGTDKQVTLDANAIVLQEEECDNCDKSSKVSKWTKVKAAFRWEKASTSVADTKSQDSGIHVPVNMEIARYLRVPSTSDELGHSPADSGAAGISTPGSLSTTSSNEDFHRSELRTPYEDIRSSEDEHSHHNYIPHSKEEHSSTKSKYHHRTPWAKMKEIIHTRNSFKKKHRLSAASDDIQIDVEFCSDNEDVFEDEPRSSLQISSSPIPECSTRYIRVNSSDIQPEIIERYQKALADIEDKNVSRWTIVKKAFITNQKGHSCPASPRVSDSNIEEEIQRNYLKLQKKLSLEFQEKLSEWERLKQNSPGASNPPSSCSFVEENRDPNFIKKMEEWQKIKGQQPSSTKPQMPSELDLPPEFKKKLQEWEKIKKSSTREICGSKKKLGEVGRWKSLSGHRYDTSAAIEYPPLSEDFRKKLDEWKQIKASGGSVSSTETAQKKPREKTPSPRLIRKNSSPKHSKKQKGQDKELHWYEKELGKIEKEKQRLERERQKFLEREERLSKLRKSITGGSKKEVLIHTPSGFYRFEGISRKFTQKLYEWEKAKGIGPEASTFALLSSSYTPETRPTIKRHSAPNTPPLIRSKSADSIAISALNLTCPLISHQPSSLSLNDVEELEKECLADSKSSSLRYLLESEEALDMDEPEAVLVEVEDYEEETAAPLQTFVERHQLPIYQREEVKALCEGETVAAPKVRKSESARAQDSYNLIEETVSVLRQLAENEIEVKNISQFGSQNHQNKDNKPKLRELHGSQKQLATKLSERLLSLQEANSSVTSSICKEEGQALGHVSNILEAVQDISLELIQMAEKLEQAVRNRSMENLSTASSIFENIRDIRSKISELRRHLSYVCASSDLTAPGRKLCGRKTVVYKTLSNDSRSSRCDTTSDNSRRGSQKEEKRYIKSETSTSNNGQGAVKKRIKYRQKTLQSRSMAADTDEEEEEGTKERKNSRHKKLTRSRTISDSNTEEKPVAEVESLPEQLIVPTETNYVNALAQEDSKIPPESPLTLFVKTTRKLFTPIGETSLSDSGKCSESPKILVQSATLDVREEEIKTNNKEEAEKADINRERNSSQQETVRNLPPLPASPVPQRKLLKDISPSIRLMMAKYNQKVSEQDGTSTKSGNSSGSNSPVAWRSPIAERRVKVQMEKYQKELKKMSPQLGRSVEVQKSASIGQLNTSHSRVTVPIRRDSVQDGLLTATPSKSTTNNEPEPLTEHTRKSLSLNIPANYDSNRHSSEIRLQKIQKAKEEFLRSTPKSAPPQLANDEVLKFPSRNRLSQISVESDASFDAFPGALMKSASVGMINIDPDAYRQIDPELHGGGYVSLPRNTTNPKGSKFGFANIASKFRKVKMRKGKERDREKEKLNAVSALCRQSLVVDITKTVPEDGRNVAGNVTGLPPLIQGNISCRGTSQGCRRRSDSPSPSTSTAKSNTSWLKKSLFRK